MFSYGTELPSYIGLMENPYFASLCKGTRYCKCKGLETLTSLASLASLLCPLLEMLDEVNLAPGFSFPC